MFGLFKSTQGIKVVDKVWITKEAKLNAFAGMLKINSNCLFVVWFEDTFIALQTVLRLPESNINLVRAQDIYIGQAQNRMVVFAEHYPLSTVEQALFSSLQLTEVPVLSSLDEPLFQHFGGERLIEIMKKLTLNDDEVIAHSMVTKAIRNAQESVTKRSQSDQKTTSQREWFLVNMK